MSKIKNNVDIDKLSLLDDELFREVLGRPCGYAFVCMFLEEFYGLKSGSLNGKLEMVSLSFVPSDIYNQKYITGELAISLDNTYIDIEVYNSFTEKQLNISSTNVILMADRLLDMHQDKCIAQINIAKNIAKEFKPNGIMEEKFFNIESFYLIDVDNIDQLKDNNRGKNFVNLIKFMSVDRAGRKKLAKGNDKLMDLNEKIEEFIDGDEYLSNLSRRARDMQIEREEGKDEGLEQGRSQNQAEIVMNMYDNDFTIDQICSATKLTVDEINNIIKENKE